jgi:DNA-binding response OmpR family regulator
MPEVNGFTLIKWVRTKEHHEKILLMGAFTELLDVKFAHEIGADDFITKPLKQKEIIQKVEALLNSSGYTKKLTPQTQGFKTIAMNAFLRHEKIEYPIYLRLNKEKIVKIADAGDQLSDEHIHTFMEKGFNSLYLTKEDFKTCRKIY